MSKTTYLFLIGLFFSLFPLRSSIFAQTLLKANDFEATKKDLSLLGNTAVSDKMLHLTTAKPNQKGACWYKTPLNIKKGFETEFIFRLSSHDAAQKGGDGFAFVMQNQGIDKLGNVGDDIAYKTIPYAVVFEFDTHIDADDKTRNQVAVMKYYPNEKKYIREATVHGIPELGDGKEHFARIEYKNGWLTFFLDSYLFPVLSTKVDLPTQLKSDMAFIGFTSATGQAYSQHDIISWSLKENVPEPKDIDTKAIKVVNTKIIKVRSRKLTLSVYDHNKVDGDIVSLKLNDNWLLSNYTLEQKPKSIDCTVTGFQGNLVVYANSLGKIPPNTVTIDIFDGTKTQSIKLESDKIKSEAVTILYEENP